jgi:hypothetical protein
MAQPDPKIIDDEEEFLSDVAAYHEQRRSVVLRSLARIAADAWTGRISRERARSLDEPSTYIGCTRW